MNRKKLPGGLEGLGENNPITISDDKAKRVAIASESGIAVDGGFGNTKRFVIYEGHKIVDECGNEGA